MPKHPAVPGPPGRSLPTHSSPCRVEVADDDLTPPALLAADPIGSARVTHFGPMPDRPLTTRSDNFRRDVEPVGCRFQKE